MNDPHRIVSSESEELILVDDNDTEIGFASKAECHDDGGLRHRAFSLFLFNEKGELLMQQRSEEKRLWPGFWSNSCCSHPRRGESLPIATARRLSDELNISAELQHVYHFCYQAEFDERGSENELCHVYLGRVIGEVQANSSEVASVKYISSDALHLEMVESPNHFTPWFKAEWECLNERFEQALSDYAM